MQCCLDRESDKTAKDPEGRMFLDSASLNFTTMGGNRHIGLLVDDYSRLKIDMYISTKNQLQKQVLELLKIIYINFKIRVQVLRLDNAGENGKLIHEYVDCDHFTKNSLNDSVEILPDGSIRLGGNF